MRKGFFILGILLLLRSSAFSAVNLVAPSNNYRCQDNNVEFIWEPYPGGAQSYALKVSAYSDLSNPILDTSNITGTTVIKNLPGSNVQYYWRVMAVISVSPLVFDSSEIWTFTTKPAPPFTIEPATNATCVPLKAHLRWSSVNNALNYRLQISNTSLFLTLLKDTVLTTTQADITLPNWNTKYYWRVASTTNYGCTTYYSNVDSFKTNRTPPTLSQPMDSSTSLWGNIVFSWSVPTNANSYNLQISTLPDFSVVLYDEITSSNTFTKVITDYNTRYYWRVKAVYPDCETDFSTVWTFRTAYASPQNLYPPKDTFCVSNSVTLQWDAVNGATTYRLQITEADSFDLNYVVVETLISSRQFNYYLGKSLQYYCWRVRAEDKQNIGLWSDTMRFQTTYAPPRHLSPQNGEETSATVKFAWVRDIPGSVFELQISDTNNFNLLLHRVYDLSGLTTDTITLKLPHYNTKYWWRLRASDAYCRSDWSTPKYFITRLQKPNPTYPPNNATKMPLKITFEWDKPEGWESFQIHISKDPQFSTIFTGRAGLTTNSVIIGDFEPSTKYYWRVRAINKEDTSRWSDVFSFTTGPNPLEIPTLIYPMNDAQNVPTSVSFVWTKVPRAKFYQLQIATDLQFSQKAYDIVNISDTTYFLSDLQPMTEYFWRVLAYNDSTSSSWTPIWRFRTQPPVPTGKIFLSIPPNESMGLGTSLSLIWQHIPYIEFYHLQVATNDNFTTNSLVIDDSTILQPYKYITGLDFETRYYWHVRGYNAAGSTEWSETWWFQTMVSSVDDPSSIIVIAYNQGEKVLNVILPEDQKNVSNIQFFDILGRVLFSSTLVDGKSSVSIDCNNITKGVYFVKIVINGKSFVKKVVL
jgi:hypothetical protein